MRHQADRLKTEFDVVPRDDFEAVRAMAIKAREENELLIQRVEALEKALDEKKPLKTGAKVKKPSVKKAKAPEDPS